MSGKYHFNPETGRTGVCKASIRDCDFKLSVKEHFGTEQEAKEAYQKTMKSNLFATQSKSLKRPKNIKEMTVDTEIIQAMLEVQKAEAKLAMEEAAFAKAQSGRGGYWKSVEQIEKDIEVAKNILDNKQDLLDEADSKYEGWSRYVAVPGGHVHHADCSTLSTYKTRAERGLAVEASGLDEDELIELAGERACTVCFPDAPVTKRPSMLREDVKIREEAEVKMKLKAEKEEKKRLSSLRDDGKPVMYDGRPHKTMRSLETAINDDLFYAMRGVDATPPAEQNVDQETLDWYKENSKKLYENIEETREILSQRYEELDKEFDFDAFIEKKKKAHLKEFKKSGWIV